ncbi:MAG: hydrogenase formation protein HypD [Phycisphaerales bacterium]|nr:MAG: hydrogenase formation protein HypD [Phycisphaerales bacterium]
MNSGIPALRAELDERCERIGRRVTFMEVCGTHTMSVFRSGIRAMLPKNLRLVSGPGCPVCVTPRGYIDAACDIAGRDGVMAATFGDMMRVPGRSGSLETLRSAGARIRVVSSARAALQLAREHPGCDVVFLAVGFETTAPGTAASVLEADRDGVDNFSVLMSQKLIVPAMLALLETADPQAPELDGFLCPGHVSVIIGADAYKPIVQRHAKPCVVAGFEPEQILRGLAHLAGQVAAGAAALENVYSGVVSLQGNRVAQKLVDQVFVVVDAAWRQLGVIPLSGQLLAPPYRRFDATRRFAVAISEDDDDPECRCGYVIQGKVEPRECPRFGAECTPDSPVGPCMVSSEGTCAAWYKYGRNLPDPSARGTQEVGL